MKQTNNNPLLEIGLFRIAFGIYLLYYNLPFLPELSSYYGTDGMLPMYFLPKPLMVSPAFFPWPSYWFSSLFCTMLILIICFTAGLLNKFTLIPLYILQVYFYHANPLIIHEPQPLANLFLILFFFLPPNTSPLIFRSLQYKLNETRIAECKNLIKIIILFFGIYYFFVGIKKLPDPLWREGLALKHILSWSGVARDNFLTRLITGTPGMSQIFSYATLLFEMSFVLIVFTPYRYLLIVAGMILHGGIFCTMDVGTLSQILIVWYALLLDKETRSKFKNIFKR